MTEFAIQFSNSLIEEWNKELGDWDNFAHSFLTLTTLDENPATVREIHFNFYEKSPSIFFGGKERIQIKSGDSRSLTHDEILRGDDRAMLLMWLKLMHLTIELNLKSLPFIKVDDVKSGRAEHTRDCWDGAGALSEIVHPRAPIKDTFNEAQRGRGELLLICRQNEEQVTEKMKRYERFFLENLWSEVGRMSREEVHMHHLDLA
jgi:hypothetical protein